MSVVHVTKTLLSASKCDVHKHMSEGWSLYWRLHVYLLEQNIQASLCETMCTKIETEKMPKSKHFYEGWSNTIQRHRVKKEVETALVAECCCY